MRIKLWIAVAAIVCFGCASGLAQETAAATGDEKGIGEVGSRVVPFSLTTYDGKTFTEADLTGKVTKLIFWFPT